MAGSEPQVVKREKVKVVKSAQKQVTPEQALAKAAELDKEKARIAEVLSRGIVTDMITVKDGRKDRRYAWVRENDGDIAKFKMLGYEVETEAGTGEHQTGDDTRRVGDVILMSCPMEQYELIEEVRSEQKRKRLASPVKEYKKRAAEAAARDEAAPPVDFMEGNT
jgi:hypothetical protein